VQSLVGGVGPTPSENGAGQAKPHTPNP